MKDFQNWVFTLEPELAPSADQLIALLHHRLRALAPRIPKAPGQRLQPGEEVECIFLPVHKGRFLIGSLFHQPAFVLEPVAALPGLFEALLEMEGHGDYEFRLQLGADYPIPELANQELEVLVRLGPACQVLVPELDDPQALQAAGLGSDLDQAMQTLAQQFEEELAQELLAEMSQQVLERLTEEIDLEVPASVLDEELCADFQRRILPLLLQLGLDDSEIESARQDYLQQADERLQAEFRVRSAIALQAVQKKYQIPIDPQILSRLEEQMAEGLGLDYPSWFGIFDQEQQTRQLLTDYAQRLSNLQFVVSQVQFRDPEEDP